MAAVYTGQCQGVDYGDISSAAASVAHEFLLPESHQ